MQSLRPFLKSPGATLHRPIRIVGPPAAFRCLRSPVVSAAPWSPQPRCLNGPGVSRSPGVSTAPLVRLWSLNRRLQGRRNITATYFSLPIANRCASRSDAASRSGNWSLACQRKPDGITAPFRDCLCQGRPNVVAGGNHVFGRLRIVHYIRLLFLFILMPL